jgi:hypothetical protein
MTSQHIQLLRYLWAGLRLTEKAVTAPNGNVVQAVRYKTLMELQQYGWVEPDPNRQHHFRLTTEGRARALVKQRVRDFLAQLAEESPA